MHSLIGLHKNGDLVRVPDIMCVRKDMEKIHKEFDKFKKFDKSNMFAFVSSPNILAQHNTSMRDIELWCHPFRKREKHLDNSKASYIMMPESDFMDSFFVKTKEASSKYDFFYMTINDKAGILHKGLNEFIDAVPVLCGELGLRGLVIPYYPPHPRGSHRHSFKCISSKQSDVLKKYKKKLGYTWGMQSDKELASLVDSCKFGFFPNKQDCSPRIIPECLLRNKPIMVNKRIWGGWHYVNDNTGALFNHRSKESIRDAASFIMNNDFDPMNDFMSKYGFWRSSERLAQFLSTRFDQTKDFTHVYFKPYRKVMEKMLNDKSRCP